MPKHKGQNGDEELESYLTNDFNLLIYEELTEGDSVGLFEPLQFFKLLYAQYEFVKTGKAKPLSIIKSLKGQKINDHQKHFLFDCLTELIGEENTGWRSDKQLEICCNFIQKEVDRIAEKLWHKEKTKDEKGRHEELDKYITDRFNLEVYEFVKENESAFLCEPLAFLQLLHSTYEWILQNADKPLAIAERLKDTFPCRWYFLEKLEGLLKRKVDGVDLTDTEKLLHSLTSGDDKELKQLKEALEIVHNKRSDETLQQRLEKDRFNFDEVKRHIETLDDDKAKIRYLIEIKTDYQQQHQDPLYLLLNDRFDDKCDLEIKKLEKLIALERPIRRQKASQTESEAVTRNPDFTTARQVLAIHYLFKYSKADQASNADVARFIEFLTGKNYKNIYKRVCSPLGSRDKELTEDLRYIRALFEKLGLTEIVKMINNEINSGSF